MSVRKGLRCWLQGQENFIAKEQQEQRKHGQEELRKKDSIPISSNPYGVLQEDDGTKTESETIIDEEEEKSLRQDRDKALQQVTPCNMILSSITNPPKISCVRTIMGRKSGNT